MMSCIMVFLSNLFQMVFDVRLVLYGKYEPVMLGAFDLEHSTCGSGAREE